MEKAFKAGLAAREMNPDTKPSSRTTNRRMTDRDLAPTAVKAIQMMRLFSVGYKYYDGPPGEPPYKHPPHAVLFLVPQMQGIYAALTKDDWRLASLHGEHQDYSNKAIGPLIKAGLLEENWLQSGMQIATFTEWGYELLVTGETSLPENRVRHQSATAREWSARFEGEWLLRAAEAVNLVKGPPSEDKPDDDTTAPASRHR
jgi:hypothetical protein